jgi:hypothetical protein
VEATSSQYTGWCKTPFTLDVLRTQPMSSNFREILYFLLTVSIHQAYTRQAMYAHRNIEARSRNHCCRRKAISTKHYECVSVALVIRHAKRMRRIILSSMARLTLPYFSTLSHKRHDLREGGGGNYSECLHLVAINTFTFIIQTQRDHELLCK